MRLGGGLPAATGVGAVRLQVADLARSLAYYRTVLGLGVRERSATGAALGASGDAGGNREGGGEPRTGPTLIELYERPGAAPVPRQGRLGLYHFALLLPDRASLGRFVRHLDEIGVRAGASDHLVSEALYLWDPDGLGIEVYADRPRSTWRRRDGELVMGTEPLDLADVARAGEGVPWEAMPAETTVGHVHLHVGDLDRASHFYEEALGLDRTVWTYPGALFLAAGGYHHHLGLNTWAAGAVPASDEDARLLEWELVVPSAEDVEGARRRFEGAGYAVEDAESGRADGAARAAGRPGRSAGPGVIVRDPWGTAVRIRSLSLSLGSRVDHRDRKRR